MSYKRTAGLLLRCRGKELNSDVTLGGWNKWSDPNSKLVFDLFADQTCIGMQQEESVGRLFLCAHFEQRIFQGPERPTRWKVSLIAMNRVGDPEFLVEKCGASQDAFYSGKRD